MCLSPCFRLLRLYTAEQNSGSLEEIDALLGMGNWLFIEPGCLPCSCARSAQISTSCRRSCAFYEEAEVLCAHKGKGRPERQLLCVGMEWLMGLSPNSHWNWGFWSMQRPKHRWHTVQPVLFLLCARLSPVPDWPGGWREAGFPIQAGVWISVLTPVLCSQLVSWSE